MHQPDRKPPRFPFVAAVLCAACVGAAAWTWMRYSYAWDLSPGKLGSEEEAKVFETTREGSYALIRGRLTGVLDVKGTPVAQVCDSPDGDRCVLVLILAEEQRRSVHEGDAVFTGRIAGVDPGEDTPPLVHLDTTASRFAGASIAGLVVGVMGVFVFGAALRHWLNERRRSGIVT